MNPLEESFVDAIKYTSQGMPQLYATQDKLIINSLNAHLISLEASFQKEKSISTLVDVATTVLSPKTPLISLKLSDNQKMLQVVVEAAGEKWFTKADWDTNWPPQFQEKNPSTTDLNELFRLAELHDLGAITFTYEGDIAGCPVLCWLGCDGEEYTAMGATPSEALLTALYESLPKGDK